MIVLDFKLVVYIWDLIRNLSISINSLGVLNWHFVILLKKNKFIIKKILKIVNWNWIFNSFLVICSFGWFLVSQHCNIHQHTSCQDQSRHLIGLIWDPYFHCRSILKNKIRNIFFYLPKEVFRGFYRLICYVMPVKFMFDH
jgi:hypothetical protein